MAPRTTASRTQLAVGLCSLGILFLLLLSGVFYSLPSNVLSSRDGGQLRRLFVETSPQGWGFFTLAPTSPEYVPYLYYDGRLERRLATPQSKAANLYGLSRRQRTQGPEIAIVASQIRDWLECTGGVGSDCREQAGRETSNRAVNDSPVPTACGSFVITSTVPVPWAYRHSYSETRIDEKAAHVDIQCNA